jgi:hypothetical protein
MPVQRKADIKGSYYQWGSTGKKYYYLPNNRQSREKAKELAMRQGRAIQANKH